MNEYQRKVTLRERGQLVTLFLYAKLDNFLYENYWGSPTLTLLNVLNVLNVLNMPKGPS